MSPEGINQQVSALKFLYITTLEMPWNNDDFPRVKRHHKLPVVLSQEELSLFFDHIPGLKYRAGAGLRISEAVAIKVKDIDASRMLLRVENGKGGKDRYTLLSHDCSVFCGSIGAPRISNHSPARNGKQSASSTCSPPGSQESF